MISSTVGLEALLYEKPVLTLGQPFYPGYGVTLDVDSFAEIRETVPSCSASGPTRSGSAGSCTPRCGPAYPGAPVLVDRSEENAVALAQSLEELGSQLVREPSVAG